MKTEAQKILDEMGVVLNDEHTYNSVEMELITAGLRHYAEFLDNAAHYNRKFESSVGNKAAERCAAQAARCRLIANFMDVSEATATRGAGRD